MYNLSSFIQSLKKHGEIIEVDVPVDPHLEIAEIHRKVAAANGPALLFNRVKGSNFRVATNLFGSAKRMELAFPTHPEKTLESLVNLAKDPQAMKPLNLLKNHKLLRKALHVGTKNKTSAPVLSQRLDSLEKIPFLTSWPCDGGPFLTLPLVYTQDPKSNIPNLGMYRIQRFDANTCGLHFQISKGAGYHYHQAELLNQPLDVNIFLGGPPALTLSAITPLPENISELLLCSFIQEKKLDTTQLDSMNLPLISECEFAICGQAMPHERKEEGPFGDHYGYYSLKHPFPYLNVKQVFCRKDAIYPATVVGKPIQEDFIIGEYLQELLKPLIKLVMPGIDDLWSYGECGFHSLSAAKVKERFSRESLAHTFRILGEGQLALTKFLLITDQEVDLKRIDKVLPIILERCSPETDLYIFSNLSMDTLDYTGPKLNKGSKGVLLGIGEKKRELPTKAPQNLPNYIKHTKVFCPGCLLVELHSSYKENKQKLTELPCFNEWPLVILVDDAAKAAKSPLSFLWSVFTRFEPAADIYAEAKTFRHHLCYQFPFVIDAHMKRSYPNELIPLEETDKLVQKRWKEYFPKGLSMGNSFDAHVYSLSQSASLEIDKAKDTSEDLLTTST
ncbi:MAG: UbiD family decarboxylase [Chlamydiales bacterium]|nr:UbiD family decarboxylase [Chlamydiales bacterium]NCF70668.1 UbiD family decarboxylase [Chlamydiales bacterium]